MLALFRTLRETVSCSVPAERLEQRLRALDPKIELHEGGFRFLHRRLPAVRGAIVKGRFLPAAAGEMGIRVDLTARVDRRNQAGVWIGVLAFLLLIHLKARVLILLLLPLLLFSAWRLGRDRNVAFRKVKEGLEG